MFHISCRIIIEYIFSYNVVYENLLIINKRLLSQIRINYCLRSIFFVVPFFAFLRKYNLKTIAFVIVLQAINFLQKLILIAFFVSSTYILNNGYVKLRSYRKHLQEHFLSSFYPLSNSMKINKKLKPTR